MLARLRHSTPAFVTAAALASATMTCVANAQVVNATVAPPGGGAPVAVPIGNIAVVAGPGGNIRATFSLGGAAPGFPNGFGFLDDWYDFRWVNTVIGYTIGGAQQNNAMGQPIIDFAGIQQRLPLIDPPPVAAGGDDDVPYYYTAAEWAAGTFGGIPINGNAPGGGGPVSRFLDNRGGGAPWPATAVITFATYVVVDSITDPAIAANEIVVLDGFTWTYSQGPPGGPTAAFGGAIPANVGRVDTALDHAAAGGFPPPGGAGMPAWDAVPSGLGPVGRVLTACPAVVVPQGLGCLGRFTSFYEQFDPIAMDLSGMRLTGANVGPPSNPQYVASTAPASLNPIGMVGSPQTIPLADDQVVPVGSLGLFVSSNCVVYAGPGGTQAFMPSVPQLLDQPVPGWYSWTDLDPSAPGGGQVVYEEAGPIAQITYDGVVGWGTNSPNFVQFVIDTLSGDFEITWGPLSPGNPESWLVGFSPAGPSLDPGPVDLSNQVVQTAPIDIQPLTLQALGAPVQGAVAQDFDVMTTNVGPNPVFHLGLLGLARPGQSLGFLGFPPECMLHASPDVVMGPAVVPGGGALTWTALTLPAGPPSFVGFEFNLQAVTLEASGVNLTSRSSNGLKCTVGAQ